MQKEQLLEHYDEFSEWIEALKQLDDRTWHTPISEGKWSVSAIVAHILLWDEYSLRERFPNFREGAILQPFPNFQTINDQAKDHAEKTEQNDIIETLLSVRNKYMEILKAFTEEDLQTSFRIGEHTLTIKDYFIDFVEHDLHHQKQIIAAVVVPF